MSGEWQVTERPMLFEVSLVVAGEETLLIEKTPDEKAARLAFDAIRKTLIALKPRPQASLQLYLGPTALDVFEQTAEGEEVESS